MVDLANPTLAMGVRFPEQQQSVLANPLGMMKTMAETQNALIQAQTNRQILAARQKFGQIIATAPSYDAGIAAARLDPSISAFVPDLLGSLASTQQTRVATQGAEQDQGLQALHAVGQAFGAGATDPGLIEGQVTATLGALNPQSREVAVKAGKALAASVTANLPPQQEGESEADYAARLDAAVKKRSAGIAVANGYSPTNIYAQTGAVPPSVEFAPTAPGGAQEPLKVGGAMTEAPAVERLNKPAPKSDPAANVAPAAAPNVDGSALQPPIQGITPKESAQQTALGTSGASGIQSAISKGNVYPTLKTLNALGDALDKFQAGGGAAERGSAAQFLQLLQHVGLHISDETINKVGNESLADTQTFQNIVQPLMMGFLRDATAGMGQARTAEIEAFMGAMSENDDPKALLNTMNLFRKSLQMDYNESQQALKFKQGVARGDPGFVGLGLEDFPAWYAHNFSFDQLPEQNAGGVSFAPKTTAKGVQPAAAGGKKTMSQEDVDKALSGE